MGSLVPLKPCRLDARSCGSTGDLDCGKPGSCYRIGRRDHNCTDEGSMSVPNGRAYPGKVGKNCRRYRAIQSVLHGLRDQQGVGELLETNDFSTSQPPHMRCSRLHRLASLSVDAGVGSDAHHLFAPVDDLLQ